MNQSIASAPGALPAVGTAAEEAAAFRKVTWRIVPFLLLCYVVAYLDRVNVGFAKLQMLSDLKFSETVSTASAPACSSSAISSSKCPATSSCTASARDLDRPDHDHLGPDFGGLRVREHAEAMFYVMRFLLGVAEAGFFPGIILYLTYWYPAPGAARSSPCS